MTTMVEPEWDAETRDLALARDAVPRCPVCGRDPSVCQDMARSLDWVAGDAIRCHATTAVLAQEKRFADDNVEHMRALMFPVRLVEQTDHQSGQAQG